MILRILFTGILALAPMESAFSKSQFIKIDCPWDDFYEESLEINIQRTPAVSVYGALVSAYNSYDIDLRSITANFTYAQDGKTLVDLSVKGHNLDGRFLEFKYTASKNPFEPGTGRIKSDAIGTKTFLCSEVL